MSFDLGLFQPGRSDKGVGMTPGVGGPFNQGISLAPALGIWEGVSPVIFGAGQEIALLAALGVWQAVSLEIALTRCLAAQYAAPTYPTPLRTFYIDAANGSDSYTVEQAQNSGTPWKTISKFNDNCQAGDRGYFKGTFGTGENIEPGASGTADNKIVYEAWPGYSFTLPGGQPSETAAAYFTSKSHIVLKSINFHTTISGWNEALIWANGNCSYLWFQDLDIDGGAEGRISSGFTFKGATNCRVEDCTIDKVGSRVDNDADGLFIYYGSNNIVVVRNEILNCGHSAITYGSYLNSSDPNCTGGVIAQNSIGNTWAGGINLNGKARTCLIECNDIYDIATNDGGYDPGSEDGIQLEGEENIVRYNRIWNCDERGISLQAYSYAGFLQTCKSNQVYHNTIYDCGGMPIYCIVGSGASAAGGDLSGNVIENNVAWACHTKGQTEDGGYYDGDYYSIWFSSWAATTDFADDDLEGNIVRYNHFVRTDGASDKFCLTVRSGPGNQKYTLAQAEAIHPNWSNNDNLDEPELNDPDNDDFTLKATSPCIDTGRTISGVDYLGSAPDRGAYEKA